jgi:hypothetical protein
MASTIGLKIANGQFYPLLSGDSEAKKRLILTTVHDDQKSVQIDLYKSESGTMTGASYIGSLVVDDLKAGAQGAASIQMTISSDAEGTINAEAIDLDGAENAEPQRLNVSLDSLHSQEEEEQNFDAIPDFGFGNEAAIALAPEEPKKHKGPVIAIVIILIALLAGAAYWFFVMQGGHITRSAPKGLKSTEQALKKPAAQAQKAKANKQAVPARETAPRVYVPKPVPVIKAPKAAPVSKPANRARGRHIPRKGVSYTIRWGDTLRDISEAFYRTPWEYERIARYNNIPDPDEIIAGDRIIIPPRRR